MTTTTTLYRLYSADGTLLYIGIAQNWASRMKQHQEQKSWWPDVASTVFQPFPTREDAMVAEARAIKAERPLHNIVHNQRSQPAPAPAPDGWLYLIRTECCRKIEPPMRAALQVFQDGNRRLYADEHDADNAERLTVALGVRPIHWVISCPECDWRHDDDPAYSIGLSGTWPDFLAALAHLIEKDWVANSDLPVIVRQIAKWNGAG